MILKKKAVAKNPRKTQDKSDAFSIDRCGVKLTAMQLRFIVHYVTPGKNSFHNAQQAAKEAGYSKAVAKSDIYGFLQRPDIQKIIKANENLVREAVYSGSLRAMELKLRRAFLDPIDFFDTVDKEITTKNGETYTKRVIEVKKMEDMTPEQRKCIDGFQIMGPKSDPVFLMANREKELNDIIKISKELSGGSMGDGMDVEETKEIIMERVIIRAERRRKEAPEVAEYHIIQPDVGEIEEEL